MVDRSSSLGSQTNFDKELSFIARFVEGFNIGQGPKDVRVGVISFSTEAKLEFGLASYGDKRSLQNALLGIEFSLGNTYTHKAFDILLNRGFSASKRPSTVPRVGKNLPISRCQWVIYPVSILIYKHCTYKYTVLDKNTCHFKWKIKSWQILYFISTNYIQIHIVLQKKNPTKILIGKLNVIFKGNSMTRSISGVIMTDGQSTNPYKLEDVLMMVKLRGIEIFSIGKLEFQASSLTLNYCVRRNLYG